MPRKHPNIQYTPLQPRSGAAVCRAKRRFHSKLEAERAAELKNLEDTTLAITVYQCDVCRKWHLTRSKQP